MPKSFSVSTSPRPKYCCQIRFTITRAVSGFRGSTSHFARSSRVGRPFVGASGCSTAGVPGATSSAGLVKSPLMKTVVLRGFGDSAITIVVTPWFMNVVLPGNELARRASGPNLRVRFPAGDIECRSQLVQGVFAAVIEVEATLRLPSGEILAHLAVPHPQVLNANHRTIIRLARVDVVNRLLVAVRLRTVTEEYNRRCLYLLLKNPVHLNNLTAPRQVVRFRATQLRQARHAQHDHPARQHRRHDLPPRLGTEHLGDCPRSENDRNRREGQEREGVMLEENWIQQVQREEQHWNREHSSQPPIRTDQ